MDAIAFMRFDAALQAFDTLSSLIQVSATDSNEYHCVNYGALLTSLDLLFKWITLRMADNNVQSTTRLQSFLVSLLDLLRHNGHTLTDVEASILLPSVVDKVTSAALQSSRSVSPSVAHTPCID
jgi:hypothetical protein